MIRNLSLLYIIFILAVSCTSGPAEKQTRIVKKAEDIRHFFEQDLDNENPFYSGLARLYLGKDLAEGNAMIREAFRTEIKGAAESLGKAETVLTPEIAASEYFKWQMRNWVLVYYLFCEGGQALKNIEQYRDLEVADGLTVEDYFTDWNTYYREYPLARAKYGDMTEIFSMYCVYSLPELFNLYDFVEDPVTRKRMLSYEFCTPDFVVGALLIDPTLPLVPSHLFYTENKEGNKEGYPALSTQNRYNSILAFPGRRECLSRGQGIFEGRWCVSLRFSLGQ
jgi:hypothetical protein